MRHAGVTRRRRALADATGAIGLLVAAALMVLVILVAGSLRAGAAPLVAETAVCTLERLLPGGAADCGGADRRPLVLVQERQEMPSRPEVEDALRLNLQWLNEYWAAVRRLPGRTPHRDPDLTVSVPGPYASGGYVWMPPHAGTTGGIPRMELFVPGSGDFPSTFMGALFGLSHLFGQLGQYDYGAGYSPDDPLLSPGVIDWFCRRDCGALRARVLRADCMAGAYIAWGIRQGHYSDRTVQLLEEAIRNLHPHPADVTNGFPESPDRLESFREGVRKGRTTDDPFAACEVPTS
jgi:hypothetical protein